MAFSTAIIAYSLNKKNYPYNNYNKVKPKSSIKFPAKVLTKNVNT